MSPAETLSATVEADTTVSLSAHHTTASLVPSNTSSSSPSWHTKSRTATASAPFDVEGVRLVFNGSADMWQEIFNCCLQQLEMNLAADVATIVRLNRENIVIRRMKISSLIVYFNIERSLQFVGQVFSRDFCLRIGAGALSFDLLFPSVHGILLLKANSSVVSNLIAVIECRNVLQEDTLTVQPTHRSATLASSASETQSVSKLPLRRSTHQPSATRTISGSFTDYVPRIDTPANAGALGATIASLTTVGSNWGCGVFAVVICAVLLLWNLMTVFAAFIRRRCFISSRRGRNFPRFAFAHFRWLSLVCEHVYISAVLPCHHLCAHIHALHLAMHVMIMAIVAAALLPRLPAPEAPITSVIIIVAAAIAPNLFRPLVDLVFYRVKYYFAIAAEVPQNKVVLETAAGIDDEDPPIFHADDVQHIPVASAEITIEIVEMTHDDALRSPRPQTAQQRMPTTVGPTQAELDQFFDDVAVEELNRPPPEVIVVDTENIDGLGVVYFQDDDFDLVGLYRPQEEPYTMDPAGGEPSGLMGGMKRGTAEPRDVSDARRLDPANAFTREAIPSDQLRRLRLSIGGAFGAGDEVDEIDVDEVGPLPPALQRPASSPHDIEVAAAAAAASRPTSGGNGLDLCLPQDDVHPFYVADDAEQDDLHRVAILDLQPNEAGLTRPLSQAALRRVSVGDAQPLDPNVIRPLSQAALRRLSFANELAGDTGSPDQRATTSEFYGWFTSNLPGSPGLRSPEVVASEPQLPPQVTEDYNLWRVQQSPPPSPRRTVEAVPNPSQVNVAAAAAAPAWSNAEAAAASATAVLYKNQLLHSSDDDSDPVAAPAGKTAVERFQEANEQQPAFCPVSTVLDHLFAAHEPTGATSTSQLPKAVPPTANADQSSDEEFGADTTAFWKSLEQPAPAPVVFTDTPRKSKPPAGDITLVPTSHKNADISPPCILHPENKLFKKKTQSKKSNPRASLLEAAETWHRPGAALLMVLNMVLCVILWMVLSPLDSTAGSNCGLYARYFAAAFAADLLVLQQVLLVLKAAHRWLNADPMEPRKPFGRGHPFDGERRTQKLS